MPNEWKGRVQVFRKENKYLAEQSKVSTKSCQLCGNTRLLLTATLNLKTCTDCSKDIPWYKENNQGNYI